MFFLIYFPCKRSFGQEEWSFNKPAGRFLPGARKFFARSPEIYSKSQVSPKKTILPKMSHWTPKFKILNSLPKTCPQNSKKNSIYSFQKNNFQGKGLLDMQKTRSTKLQQEKSLIMRKFFGQSFKNFVQPIIFSKKKYFPQILPPDKKKLP